MAAKDRECTVCGVKYPVEGFPTCGRGYRRRTCRECTNKQKRDFKSSDPETYLISRLGRQSGRSKVEISIDKEFLKRLWEEQGGKCAVTGLHMTYFPRGQRNATGLNGSVDRLDGLKGYVKGNVRLVCARVNAMRSSGEDADLLWWCKQIIEGIEGE